MIDNNTLLREGLEAFSNFIIINAAGEVIYLNRIYARLLGIKQPLTTMFGLMAEYSPSLPAYVNKPFVC